MLAPIRQTDSHSVDSPSVIWSRRHPARRADESYVGVGLPQLKLKTDVAKVVLPSAPAPSEHPVDEHPRGG